MILRYDLIDTGKNTLKPLFWVLELQEGNYSRQSGGTLIGEHIILEIFIIKCMEGLLQAKKLHFLYPFPWDKSQED